MAIRGGGPNSTHLVDKVDYASLDAMTGGDTHASG